jgi:dGTPase
MTHAPAELTEFEKRFEPESSRPGDARTPFERDRARVVHSAGFRRLQGKTQVMGAGEGDFHRTRLTHSIECAQIGQGIRLHVEKKAQGTKVKDWFPSRDLIEAACFAHDLGHPPFGHGGEVALHEKMRSQGGFEGNGQTLRILTRLEKHRRHGRGLNPTRRLLLAILKYPVRYGDFDPECYKQKPPKCFFDEEQDFVSWAMGPLTDSDRLRLAERDPKSDRPVHHTLDCSVMELADDIAYGIHDLEDIAGRHLAPPELFRAEVSKAFAKASNGHQKQVAGLTADEVSGALLGDSFERKEMVGRLVNVFVTKAEIQRVEGFEHPLLAYSVGLPEPEKTLLKALKGLSFDLVISKAQVRQLERRGQRVVASLFDALSEDPEQLIPARSLADLKATGAPEHRLVCDYIAGMTDSYAEKVYHRLFTPGFGSSSDEI